MIIKYYFKQSSIVYETPNLYSIVLKALTKIPKGKVTTYKDLALALGDKIASRAIGYIMKTNPYPDVYPCYKVVSSSGNLGGYSLGLSKKIEKLKKDGITVSTNGIPDLEKFHFDYKKLSNFVPPVLTSLKRIQEALAKKLVFKYPSQHDIKYVLSFDLSFINGPPDISIGSGVLYDFSKNELLLIAISIVPIFMPYIPTYLAFRELPAVLATYEAIKKEHHVDLLLLDGQGILHPRNFGIACHAGVLTNTPSIGIAKSLLVGKIHEKLFSNPEVYSIVLHGKVYGYLIKKNNHKIIISPGYKISLDDTLNFVLKLPWPNRYSEPLPIRLPHIIVTRLKKELKRRYDLYKKSKQQRTQKTLDHYF